MSDTDPDNFDPNTREAAASSEVEKPEAPRRATIGDLRSYLDDNHVGAIEIDDSQPVLVKVRTGGNDYDVVTATSLEVTVSSDGWTELVIVT